jgi:hypothetical protein
MTDLEMLVKLSKRVLLSKCPWILDINEGMISTRNKYLPSLMPILPIKITYDYDLMLSYKNEDGFSEFVKIEFEIHNLKDFLDLYGILETEWGISLKDYNT